MKLNQYLILFLSFYFFQSFGQTHDSIPFNELKNGISKPSILSMHPFGIFFNRIQGNFKIHATQNTQLNLSLESANVWALPIKVYVPLDQDIRNVIKNTVWHVTEFLYDEESLNAETIDLKFDGVIKGLKARISFNIEKNHELNIGVRMFLLTDGKFPFSSLTGDDFIEFFHKTIAGGNDPFGRKLFGLNQAEINYKDQNKNSVHLNKGDFFLGGIETDYYYYPNVFRKNNKNFFMNFGTHLGTNISTYNSSIDLGLSINAVKRYTLKNQKNIHIGISTGMVRKNIISFNKNNVNFGTNNLVGFLESVLEYSFVSKKEKTHSFGADFYIQTSFNKKKEFDYLIPIRNGITEKSWITGLHHLYKNNNYWTLMYSFTKKITTTFYIQQDLTLNNNPDIQTGVSITFPL